jgi:CubicO group peptidase (beta-lactamase class C family)
VIVHRGAIVYERYSPNPDDGPDVVMPSYSMAKSVTSAAVGILVREGVLDVDDVAPVPEWHEDPDDPRARATIEHLLHMATGVPWQDGLAEGDDMLAMASRDDQAGYAASLPATGEPGEVFDDNTGTSMLLARIVGEAVGDSPEATRAFLDRELFGPLGMDPTVAFDDAGTWLGGYAVDTTARDYARLGLLYARGGVWDGQQILDEGWVEYTRTPSPSNPEYGAHWWLDAERPGVSYAVGIRGQVITVDPAHDLVVVQLSTVGGDLPLAQTEAILGAFTFVDR